MDNIYDFTEDEFQEIKSYKYDSDIAIDNAIERIKDIDIEIERIEELSKAKIQQIKDTTELKISKLNKKKFWDLQNLGAILDADETIKSTKTQKKKDFISGTVIRKFATEKMVKPELSEKDILIKFPDFKKEKITLDWAELKKTLIIKDNKVWNTDGEIVDEVGIEYVPAETIIK